VNKLSHSPTDDAHGRLRRQASLTRMYSSIPPITLPNLLLRLRAVLEEVVVQGAAFDMRGIVPEMQDSALNLAQYLALRRKDLRPLQQHLAALGLSSLGRVETHVEASLSAVVAVLEVLCGERASLPEVAWTELDAAHQRIAGHADRLLGAAPLGRDVRIMVTLPSQAAEDSSIADSLVGAGMDVARINCAHDGPAGWRRMAEHVREASEELGRPVRIAMDLGGPKIRTGALGEGQVARLHVGDRLVVTRSEKPRPSGGGPPRIGCMLPEALRTVREGDAIFFDDGKCSGVVRAVGPTEIEVQIQRAKEKGVKLRPDQGINLPTTRLVMPALTDRDREDLETVVELADIVSLSFTQTAHDVRALRSALADLGRPDLGVIAKIETRTGFENLPTILQALMEGASSGVMIARGDLAVELGYERLAEVQEEILWLCEAAHMPVIWATQVLESLAKKGIPSRAEITDAAMGERAECVMLNKGPYVLDAMAVLDDILRRMQGHQRKKTPLLRALTSFG